MGEGLLIRGKSALYTQSANLLMCNVLRLPTYQPSDGPLYTMCLVNCLLTCLLHTCTYAYASTCQRHTICYLLPQGWPAPRQGQLSLQQGWPKLPLPTGGSVFRNPGRKRYTGDFGHRTYFSGWATGPLRKGLCRTLDLSDQTDQTTGQLLQSLVLNTAERKKDPSGPPSS